MSLQEEINQIRQEIWTDSYSMSIGECISLYEKNDLYIQLDYSKRIFHKSNLESVPVSQYSSWSFTLKSAFIESIFLGIPISPIFICPRNDGVWDVVDGVKRLSTIYEFVGILKTETQSKFPLTLPKAIHLPCLEGKKWDDPNDSENSLTQAQRLLIKRTKITLNIVEKKNDPMFRYELFRRLNLAT